MYAKEKSEKNLKTCMLNNYLSDLVIPEEKFEVSEQSERAQSQIE
jgi:hypothetical protein